MPGREVCEGVESVQEPVATESDNEEIVADEPPIESEIADDTETESTPEEKMQILQSAVESTDVDERIKNAMTVIASMSADETKALFDALKMPSTETKTRSGKPLAKPTYREIDEPPPQESQEAEVIGDDVDQDLNILGVGAVSESDFDELGSSRPPRPLQPQPTKQRQFVAGQRPRPVPMQSPIQAMGGEYTERRPRSVVVPLGRSGHQPQMPQSISPFGQQPQHKPGRSGKTGTTSIKGRR
jgi:hypothetical protein